jgi:hypothetical protein
MFKSKAPRLKRRGILRDFPKSKINVLNFGIWSFGFVSCFGFRISYLWMLSVYKKTYNKK